MHLIPNVDIGKRCQDKELMARARRFLRHLLRVKKLKW